MALGRYQTIIPDIEFWKEMIPCQAGCPIRTDAGRYVQLIVEERDRDSFLTARSPNPFASVCGRICAAPCESRCRRGRIDAPVSIRALKRYACEKFGVESMDPDTQNDLFEGKAEPGNQLRWHLPLLMESRKDVARGQSVAVVGAGPAGLSCAHDLALMGYQVTVFEATDSAGGMMVHGIPEFRLPRSVIDKEIEKILGLGVTLRLKRPLRPDFGLRELKESGFQSVFLSVGTQRGRDLKIEGSDLDGVIKAIDFLINVNHGYRVNLGKSVLIIGGGFVAFDAARMALRTALEESSDLFPTEGAMVAALDAARAAVRAGVPDVRMVSLESFQEMPVMRSAQGREEFEEASQEGIGFTTQRSARRFIGSQGRVKAVELIGVKRTYDEQGRFNPVYDPSISETVETDTVILAIGQQADLSFLREEDRLELTPQGTIRVDPDTLATSAPGVFAGGDVAFGPRNLIEAIANGKRAALSIDEFLRQSHGKASVSLHIEKIPTRCYHMSEGYELIDRQAPPSIPLDRRTGISEVEVGYDDRQARRQAQRCLYCHIQTIYDPEKCVLCNRCVDICPEYCLKLVPVDELKLDSEVRDTIVSGMGLSAFEALSAMIKDDDKCIRCGLCAIRCPTDAMTMEVFHYEEQETAGSVSQIRAGASRSG